MAAAVQQTPVYYVASGPQGQSQVLIQMQPSLPRPQSDDLYFRKHHKVLGILQMSVGCLCFIMEIIDICISYRWPHTCTGFYTGIIFFVAGLMGYLAYQRNNHRFIIACMVMSIIASLTSVSGTVTSLMEMRPHQMIKQSVVIGACAFELLLSIIHASFTCVTCCHCCWPDSRRFVTSMAVPSTLIIQQPSNAGPSFQTTVGAVGGSSILQTAPLQKKTPMARENGRAEYSDDPPPYSQIS